MATLKVTFLDGAYQAEERVSLQITGWKRVPKTFRKGKLFFYQEFTHYDPLVKSGLQSAFIYLAS